MEIYMSHFFYSNGIQLPFANLTFAIQNLNHKTLWAFCYRKLLNYQRVLDDTSESG